MFICGKEGGKSGAEVHCFTLTRGRRLIHLLPGCLALIYY